MSAIASQITSLTIVYSIVYSDTDQRKHQSSASLAFVQGTHRGPVNSPHIWPVTRKMLSFDDVIVLRPFCPCPIRPKRLKASRLWGVKWIFIRHFPVSMNRIDELPILLNDSPISVNHHIYRYRENIHRDQFDTPFDPLCGGVVLLAIQLRSNLPHVAIAFIKTIISETTEYVTLIKYDSQTGDKNRGQIYAMMRVLVSMLS